MGEMVELYRPRKRYLKKLPSWLGGFRYEHENSI
jgi:hypothetical protein